MSIVEKVVGRERENRAAKATSVPAVSALRGRTNLPDEQIAKDAILLSHLSDRGLVTVLEDDDLSRAFRFLKRAVLAKIFDPSRSDPDVGKVIMISSAMPGAGKSFLAFNLAASIAREKLIDVVLIDADTVRHNLSTLLGVDDREGLVETLMAGEIKAGVLATDLPGLRFVPSGMDSESATEVLASEYMADALASLRSKNTVVVLDTTPLLVSSEADAIAAHVDHMVIVIEAGETSVDEIDVVLQMLKKSDAPVSFIMNKLKSVSKSGVPDHYKMPY